MKRFSKIYFTLLLGLVFSQLFSLCFFVAVPVAQAADDPRELKLAVPFNNFKDLGKIEEKACDPARANDPTAPQCMYVPWLVNYIGNAYRYGVVIGSVIAVVSIMIGGLLYMTAGVNPQMASRGKEFIVGSVTGLALLLGSYMLLNIVNPNLVHLKPIKVEVVKEAKMTLVTYCSELDQSKYTIEGAATCGVTAKFKSKDPKVKDLGECIGDLCADPLQKCAPISNDPTTAFKCQTVLVYGSVKDYQKRYLEEICLYSVAGNELTSVYCEKYGRGVKAYKITSDKIDINKLNATSAAVLRITLADTGREDLSITYGDTAGQVLSSISGSALTVDDDYYVGRAKSDPAVVGKNYIGRWIEPTCPSCVVMFRKDSGDLVGSASGAWQSQLDCNYFSVLEMKDGGIRVDIDERNFREDYDIDCKAEGGNISPGLKVGMVCGEDSQCASKDCESEGGVKQCECNKDSDCDPGFRCQTSFATWNNCVAGKRVGEACTSGAECTSKNCSSGTCFCSKDNDCPDASQICNESYSCVPGVPIGGLCNNDADCVADAECYTDHWYGVGPKEKRCQCSSDSQCGKGKQCIKVESGCGWNYCKSTRGSVEPVAAVPKNYNPWLDSNQGDKSKGLCESNGECISGDCIKDWGVNNCNACGYE